jgi:hypothetical protein
MKDGRIIGDARGRACNPEICRDLAPRSKAAVGRVGEVIVPSCITVTTRNRAPWYERVLVEKILGSGQKGRARVECIKTTKVPSLDQESRALTGLGPRASLSIRYSKGSQTPKRRA